MARFPQIERVVLFGSRAKGSFRVASDIDLWLEGKIDWQTKSRIELALEELWLPQQFDLILAQTVTNEELKKHVARVGKVVYQRIASE